ncbi:hypothetical protein FKP32DRAFT_1598795 [Trametes sanguinea]|nr:hypothetical protein FKP32DRAFT_1598795 [Trametes sanguinea]
MFALALFVLIVSSSSSLSMCSLVAVFSSLGVTFPRPDPVSCFVLFRLPCSIRGC